MDWQRAIERQGAALRRIVASFVAMVGACAGPAADAAELAAAERPPPGRRRRPTHEVHTIPAEAHACALQLLSRPDRS